MLENSCLKSLGQSEAKIRRNLYNLSFHWKLVWKGIQLNWGLEVLKPLNLGWDPENFQTIYSLAGYWNFGYLMFKVSYLDTKIGILGSQCRNCSKNAMFCSCMARLIISHDLSGLQWQVMLWILMAKLQWTKRVITCTLSL